MRKHNLLGRGNHLSILLFFSAAAEFAIHNCLPKHDGFTRKQCILVIQHIVISLITDICLLFPSVYTVSELRQSIQKKKTRSSCKLLDVKIVKLQKHMVAFV